MKFDNKLVNESLNTFIDFLTSPNKYQQFTFELPEGFNNVPVIEQVRAHSELIVEKDKMVIGERITRLMISGKPVEIFLEEKSLGKIIMNGNAEWDTLPIFVNHPFALSSLIEVCLGDLLGKYLPPLKSTETKPQAEAEKA